MILIHLLERFKRRLEQRRREELLRILTASRNERPEVLTPEQLQDAVQRHQSISIRAGSFCWSSTPLTRTGMTRF